MAKAKTIQKKTIPQPRANLTGSISAAPAKKSASNTFAGTNPKSTMKKVAVSNVMKPTSSISTSIAPRKSASAKMRRSK